MMRTLLYGMFGLALIASTTTLTTTQALADPGENNGNHYGQYKNGNNGNDRSVPIRGDPCLVRRWLCRTCGLAGHCST